MATTAKSTSTNSTRTSRPKQTTTSAPRSETSQVREGVTKARNGAVAIVRESAERALDLPVGAALTLRDRVEDALEPWTTESTRERELKSLRTQVTRELNRFERRGGQARRKATQRARSTRNRVQREVKARRRDVEKTVRQNRGKAETQLKKARTVVQDRVPVLS
jgi:hypothetical protein